MRTQTVLPYHRAPAFNQGGAPEGLTMTPSGMLVPAAQLEAEEAQPPEGDETFLLAAKTIIQHRPKGLPTDFSLTAEQAAANRDKGTMGCHFGGPDGSLWTLILNGNSTWDQHIPPGHLEVQWKGKRIAVLSPYMTGRICWACRLKGQQAHNIGKVIPGFPCPNCGQLDWFGTEVGPDHLERDCLEEIARVAKIDALYGQGITEGAHAVKV